VNWADLMAAQGAFGTDFYDRSTRTRTIVGTMLWTEYSSLAEPGCVAQLNQVVSFLLLTFYRIISFKNLKPLLIIIFGCTQFQTETNTLQDRLSK